MTLLGALLACVLAASAAEVEVAPARGALEPGLHTEVDVVVVDDAGEPLAAAPEVVAGGRPWVLLGAGGSPGVWRFAAVGPDGVDEVTAKVSWPGGSVERDVPVRGPASAGLEVRPVTRPARSRVVLVPIVGRDLPPSEDLQVVTSEGRVTGVRREGDRLEVALEPDDRPFARRVLVGVRDARKDALPAWGVVRLTATVDVPVETTPGSTVEIEVGGRKVGPVRVGEGGKATLTLEHGPEETSARIRVVDPSGSEAVRPFALTGDPAVRLLPFVVGPRYPGEPPPEVLLHALRADGRPWGREAPTCRGSAGELPVVRVEAGTWRVQLPPELAPETWDLRLRCALGADVDQGLSVRLAEGVPVGLSVRVWPEVLSTDFPVADVSALLVNAAGERIAGDGRWTSSAGLGFVRVEDERAASLHAAYEADLAAEVGEDELQLAWWAGAGRGRVDRLVVVGARGGVAVRALDPSRRPLVDREVTLRAGGGPRTLRTDRDGWALFELAGADAARRVVAEAEGRSVTTVVRAGVVGPRGPGRPDLAATAAVTVDPGRVAEIELDVEPKVVRPRTTASVRVRLLDRSGGLASAAPPELTVSEGVLHADGVDADGVFRWTWVPPPGFRRHEVTVTARSADVDLSVERRVVVEPAPVDHWLGVSLGVQSNLATEPERAITSPAAGLDAGVRIRTGPKELVLPSGRPGLFFRAGVGWYGAGYTTLGPGGVSASKRMDLVPVRVGLELRMAYPSVSWWVTLQGLVAPYVGSQAFGGVVVTRRVAVLRPGVTAGGGVGLRVPGGELSLELSGTFLESPGDDISYDAFVGGLAGSLGYRVFF